MACHLTYSTRYQLHCVKEALHRSEQRGRRSQLLDEIRTEARYRIYDDVEREVRANLGLNMSRRLKKAIHKRAMELTETYRWKEKHFNDLHRQVEKCAQSLEKNIHTLRKQKIYLQKNSNNHWAQACFFSSVSCRKGRNVFVFFGPLSELP